MDPDTVLWWMGQSDEARAAIAYNVDGEKRMALLQALQKFQEWLIANGQEGKRPYVWGNGAGFDCTIMANAYEAVRKVSFIGYWNGFQDRDVRTVVDMGRDLLGFDPKKTCHSRGCSSSAGRCQASGPLCQRHLSKDSGSYERLRSNGVRHEARQRPSEIPVGQYG